MTADAEMSLAAGVAGAAAGAAVAAAAAAGCFAPPPTTTHSSARVSNSSRRRAPATAETDVIGALKWFFHIRRGRHGGIADADGGGGGEDDELISVHWEGSIKLFMKLPEDGGDRIMSNTYDDPGAYA